MATIDTEVLKQLMTLLRPEPAAPVLPVAPLAPLSHNSSQDLLMGADIQRIKEDIREIKDDFKRFKENYVSLTDFGAHVQENEKSHDDFEIRMREISTRQTQILTIGSGLILLMTAIQVWLKLAGH